MSTLSTTNIKHPSSASNNIVLDSSGRVGVGSSTPQNKFVVASSGVGYEIDQSSIGNTNLLLSYDRAASTYRAVANYYGSTYSWNDSGTERARIDSSGNFAFNSGYGSVATAYGCRAWVNFNGIGTVSVRGSGNVSSITDVNIGEYRINFSSSMPDANYCALGSIIGSLSSQNGFTYSYVTTAGNSTNATASYVEIVVVHVSQGQQDHSHVNVAVFR